MPHKFHLYITAQLVLPQGEILEEGRTVRKKVLILHKDLAYFQCENDNSKNATNQKSGEILNNDLAGFACFEITG